MIFDNDKLASTIYFDKGSIISSYKDSVSDADCICRSVQSIVIGKNCESFETAKRSITVGNTNINRGNSTAMFGQLNKTITYEGPTGTNNGDASLIAGNSCEASRAYECIIGQGLKGHSRNHKVAFGRYNEDNGQYLFELGYGSSDNARSTIFGVEETGNIVTKGSGNFAKGVKIGGNLEVNGPSATINSLHVNNGLTISNGSNIWFEKTAGSPELFIDSNRKIYSPTIDQINTSISGLSDTKANKADTLAGYGIADAYTTTQTDSKITEAINKLDVAEIRGSTLKTITSISQTNGKISATYSDIDTYSKNNIDAKDTAAVNSAKSYTDTAIQSAFKNQYIESEFVSEDGGPYNKDSYSVIRLNKNAYGAYILHIVVTEDNGSTFTDNIRIFANNELVPTSNFQGAPTIGIGVANQIVSIVSNDGAYMTTDGIYHPKTMFTLLPLFPNF